MKLSTVINTLVSGLVVIMPLTAHSTPMAQNYYSMQTTDSSGTTQTVGPGFTPYNGTPTSVSLTAAGVSAAANFNNGPFPNPAGNPSISSSASVNDGVFNGGIPGSQSAADISYFFTIIAPSGTVGVPLVPIDVSGSTYMSANGTGNADVYAYLYSISGGVTPSIDYNCTALSTALCNTNTFTLSASLPSFTAAEIALNLNTYNFDTYSGNILMQAFTDASALCIPEVTNSCYAGPGGTAYTGGSAAAYIDPYIYIDPTFLANNPGYSLEISAGLNNNPPSNGSVPEPESIALFGIGLLGLVGMRRRRKQV